MLQHLVRVHDVEGVVGEVERVEVGRAELDVGRRLASRSALRRLRSRRARRRCRARARARPGCAMSSVIVPGPQPTSRIDVPGAEMGQRGTRRSSRRCASGASGARPRDGRACSGGGCASGIRGVGYGPWASPTSGDGSKRDFEPVLDAFAENFDARGEVGAAVCVYVDGRAGRRPLGRRRRRDDRRGRGQPDTVVLVYSSTKGVTSVCANLLIERGLLDPDAPVARYWPEFAADGKDAITVAQVLSHQAGPAARGGRLHARRGARRGIRWCARSPRRSRSGSRARSTATTCARSAGSSASSFAGSTAARSARSGARRSRSRSASTSGSGCPRRSSRASPGSCRRRHDLGALLKKLGGDLLLAGVFSNPSGPVRLQRHVEHARAARGRAAVVERHRRRALAGPDVRVVHRRGRRRAHVAAGDGRGGDGRAGVRQGRGADDRQLLRSRLHARAGRSAPRTRRARSATPARAARSRSPIPTRGLAFGYVMNDLRFDRRRRSPQRGARPRVYQCLGR